MRTSLRDSDADTKSSATFPALAPVVSAIAVIGAVAHLIQARYFVVSAWELHGFHLGFALLVVFLSQASSSASRRRAVTMLVLAVLSSSAALYVWIEYESLITTRVFEPSELDVVVTIALVTLTLVATKLEWGFALPVLAVVAIVYAYFGNYVPSDLFFHSGIDFVRLTSYLAIPSFQGVLGSLTGLSAATVFIFMVYVGMLGSTGGIKLVLAVATALSGTSRSAPALMSILSSGFMGMLSGSTVANVASTGTMTIPLMKRSGFKAEEAGAIEAVASLGGQFTPPIMGLTAFLIVGVAGIPYATIVVASVTPALVYYAYLAFVVHFRARCRTGPSTEELTAIGVETTEALPLFRAVREYGHLVLSLLALIYFLAVQEPPAMAATRAIIVIGAAELLKGPLWALWGKKPVVGGLASSALAIFRGLKDGTMLGVQLAIILATIGILTDVVVITGFAQKLSFLILNLAEGAVWIPLTLSAVACLIFGLGLPTPAAYVLVALFGVPALLAAGVPRLHSHLFVFYFANMSAITPPVALAPLVASKIAESGYFKTAWVAMQLGLPGFVLPFLFAVRPGFLIQGGVRLEQLFLVGAALAAVVILNAAATGFFYWRLSWSERVVLFVVFLLLVPMDWRPASVAALSMAFIALRRVMDSRARDVLRATDDNGTTPL
jgi:TRAP transporter 4TM/12TM fusion protein